MALDIIVVQDPSKPHWEDTEALNFGEINPTEWESLFFYDLGIKSFLEFPQEQRSSEKYKEYYSSKLSDISKKFPMVSRISNYYQRVFFSQGEVRSFYEELLTLENLVRRQESMNLVKQLAETCETAIKRSGSILLVPD